jgi:hypothetical protein
MARNRRGRPVERLAIDPELVRAMVDTDIDACRANSEPAYDDAGPDHAGALQTERKNLRLEDLSRVPAETKAAVIRIVEQIKRRTGWRAYRRLAALGVPRSVTLSPSRTQEE